jgi:Ca2+-binding EF-hand superfamily protein
MSSPKKPSQQSLAKAFESRVDDLERRLKEKLEVGAGFADIEVRARKLIKLFRHFDVDDSGVISYPEFLASMTKLNFVGCTREIEALYNKYDDDASGTIDYTEFALHVFGISEKAKFDERAKNIIERVKSAILERGWAVYME